MAEHFLIVALVLFITRINSQTAGTGGDDVLKERMDIFQKVINSFQTDLELVVQKLQQSEKRLDSTTADLYSVKSELKAVTKRLQTAETELSSTTSELRGVKSDLVLAQTEIVSLKIQLNSTKGSNPHKSREITPEFESVKTNGNDAHEELQTMGAGLPINASTKINQPLPEVSKDTEKTVELNIQLSASNTTVRSSLSSRSNMMNKYPLLENSVDQKIPRVDTHSPCCDQLRSLTDLVNGMKTDIVFEVTQSAKLSGWTTLNFDTVQLNTGGGYNATSGMFTAPLSGTYLFWADLDISYGGIDYNEVYIMKGTEVVARGYTKISPSIDHSVISVMAVVYLRTGEQVHFELMAKYFAVEGGKRSSYGGTLIRVH